MLNGKTVVLGVSGGIAVYKACDLVSKLKKLGLNVHVIMTKAATEFVSPLTFQSLSQNYVVSDMFVEPKTWDVEHITLAKKADLFLIVPATANVIGKIANGIADDMLTTTVMATKAPVLIAPAMNTNMYENVIVQNNIEFLQSLGYNFVEPDSGRLACGDIGAGKLANVDTILDRIVDLLNVEQDLKGQKIVVTAGPTVERIDPVRFLSNRSTGKMGYSIASEAAKRGADVTLISGPTNLKVPTGLSKYVQIESADELYEAMVDNFDENRVFIQSAAVADYKPNEYSDKKIKKSDNDLVINLGRNKDIAYEIGKNKKAKGKKTKKNLDFILANDLTQKGAGFKADTNIVKIIDKEGIIEEYPKMKKEEVANIILDKVKNIL